MKLIDDTWTKGPRGIRKVADTMSDLQPVFKKLYSTYRRFKEAGENGNIGPDGSRLRILLPIVTEGITGSEMERYERIIRREFSPVCKVLSVSPMVGGFNVTTGVCWD